MRHRTEMYTVSSAICLVPPKFSAPLFRSQPTSSPFSVKNQARPRKQQQKSPPCSSPTLSATCIPKPTLVHLILSVRFSSWTYAICQQELRLSHLHSPHCATGLSVVTIMAYSLWTLIRTALVREANASLSEALSGIENIQQGLVRWLGG